MDIRFDGRGALVTGAGKGIGRAVAKALWEAGARVVAVSRTQADLESLQSECPGMQTICVDLSDWDKTRAAMEALDDIELLVNNAGVAKIAPFLETKRETLDEVLDTNLRAVFNISQVIARKMVAREAGAKGCAIVNVSSQASRIALPDHAAYCVSKAALDHLTRCLALELGPHQIRTNCVNPTVVYTELGMKIWNQPEWKEKKDAMMARVSLGRFAEVKDVVHAIIYLLSDKADMINGAIMPIDGGVWCS